MGYSNDDKMVRIDFFKQSGKWYTTEEMLWDRYFSRDDNGKIVELIHDTFRRCLNQAFGDYFKGMIAVCLEPYHENAYPLMLINR